MTRRARVALGIVLGAIALSASHVSAQTTLPLVQQSDVTYLGAFALPSWANGATYGTSFFEYGGHALTVYKDPSTGKRTLFMEGHAQRPGQVAQVEIPATLVKSTTWSALPMAPLLQPFYDITAPAGVAPDPSSCSGNPSFVYGMLGTAGRLLASAACSYGGSQTTSHGVRSTVLSSSGFNGWYGFTGTNATPRALAGPMFPIPQEWQSAFGGPAMTGQCCISVTGSTSAGPSLTVFDPADVGTRSPIPGKTVLFYPLSNPACGSFQCEAKQSPVYNLTTVYGGGAFVPGTRSVLFVTAHGTGCYWYGGWDENAFGPCPATDPNLQDVKGPHAPPYQYQILAYDANDLVAVKNGSKQTWEPKPYATIVLNGMPSSTNNKIKGAGYDPETGRLYVAQDYGDKPRIEVFQITQYGGTGGGGTTAGGGGGTVTILPPTNLTVK